MIADIVAANRNGVPILVVEVKARQTRDAQSQLRELLRGLDSVPPYAMIVDPESIQLYSWDGDRLDETARLDARYVFARYDETFGAKRVFEPYFTSLVEAWLRDLAYNWKSAAPPGRDELQATGVLEHLEGGTTKREVRTRGAALR